MSKNLVRKKVYAIPLTAIDHADENPREAARSLLENGYEIFVRRGGNKDKSLWHLATGNAVERAKYVKLMEEHEPEICSMGRTFLTCGQIQAIQVREVAEDQYAVVCGLRRCLAWLYIRAVAGEGIGCVDGTIENITPLESANRAVIENVHRKAHDKVEMAKAVQTRINLGHNVQDIANSLGVSVGTINNYLEIAQASPEVQCALQNGELNLGEVRDIVKEVKKGVPEKKAIKKIAQTRRFKPRGSRRVLLSYADVLDLYCQQNNPLIRNMMAKILQLTYEEAEAIRKSKEQVVSTNNEGAKRKRA